MKDPATSKLGCQVLQHFGSSITHALAVNGLQVTQERLGSGLQVWDKVWASGCENYGLDSNLLDLHGARRLALNQLFLQSHSFIEQHQHAAVTTSHL